MCISRYAAMILSVTLMAGCASAPGAGPLLPSASPSASLSPAPSAAVPASETGSGLTITPCRIADGAGTGTLLLASLEDGSIYSLETDGLAVLLDGGSSSVSALRDGMVVDVSHTGMILETYPAQFGDAQTLSGDSAYTDDRCGLYLQVLEDLLAASPGLSDGADKVGMDLSGLADLSESEKAAVIWAFSSAHDLTPITGTLEEIWEQGYLTPMTEPAEGYEDSVALYFWEDGVHITLETVEDAAWSLPSLAEGEEPPTLTAFNAQIWRSGLGAYFFSGCVGVQAEDGSWTYSVGSEVIA